MAVVVEYVQISDRSNLYQWYEKIIRDSDSLNYLMQLNLFTIKKINSFMTGATSRRYDCLKIFNSRVTKVELSKLITNLVYSVSSTNVILEL